MFSNRVRFCVMGWLIVSVAVFVVRLGPVLARYRADEQKFADLAFEAKQPLEIVEKVRLQRERAVVAQQGDEQRVSLHLPGEGMRRHQRIGGFEVGARGDHDHVIGSLGGPTALHHHQRRQRADAHRAREAVADPSCRR